MQIIKTVQAEIRRIRNDSYQNCKCGRCPTYRYNYRFFVGNQWCWTYARCQECLENEFVEFDRGITQMRSVIPDLPNKRWKVKREGAWSAERHTIVPFA